MSSREERIALNEAVFREVNERIKTQAERFQLQSERLDLICECGDRNCTQPISMSYVEYEGVRSDPRRFAVHPGHGMPDVDQVLERRQGYDIVVKDEGISKVIAESTDPRS